MRGSLLILSMMLFAACSEPTAIERAAGVYDLVTVDSKPLPYEYTQSTWLSGSLTLRDNGTFSMENTYHYRGEPSPRVEQGVTGTFEITGDQIRFSNKDGSTIDGSYTGETMTYGAFAYSRRD